MNCESCYGHFDVLAYYKEEICARCRVSGSTLHMTKKNGSWMHREDLSKRDYKKCKKVQAKRLKLKAKKAKK